jgi:hypothetical protein
MAVLMSFSVFIVAFIVLGLMLTAGFWMTRHPH